MVSKSKRKGLLFVISGPSGCGKTTLGKRLLRGLPDLFRSVSVTTRPKRKGEKEGREYFFVSKLEFNRLRQKNKFLEAAQILGHFYGTPKDFVLAKLKQGKDVLLIIDVQGAMQIKKRFPAAIFIFINISSWRVLEERLKKRGLDSSIEIQKRLNQAKKELLYKKYYDYEIINDRIDKAREEVKAIILAQRCRIKGVP